MTRPLARALGAVAVLLAGTAAYQRATWPDVERLAHERPSSTAFIDRYREEQRRAGNSDRVAWHWVPQAQISPNLQRAVIASEDIGFFSHHGFDVGELQIAVREAMRRGASPRGASTITQQLAKNLWLSPSRNPLRKVKEAILTRQLEAHLSKNRILELYLNVVEFGRGVFGAEAAAQRYFGKPASALSEHEAALLAATLPRPATWNPESRSRTYHRHVARIQDRMARATFLWRRVGGAPDSAPTIAIDSVLLDSLLRSLLADTLLDTITTPGSAAPPDSIGH
ncbi:MAG: monofunctional biosynthetic peptidoglycan transglycosylase [Gemmatimonadetes bacterium]|nr:monofunctional biosynthetic peptidoglycan transglycosylase [Gemmatimonadota bacterium]